MADPAAPAGAEPGVLHAGQQTAAWKNKQEGKEQGSCRAKKMQSFINLYVVQQRCYICFLGKTT